MGQITLLLEQIRNGEPDGLDRLTRAIHGILEAMAHARIARERRDPMLQTTALVNEAVVRLLRGRVFEKSPNHGYLFGAAAKAMRDILVEHGRRRQAAARAGMANRVVFDDAIEAMEQDGLSIVELAQALDELATRSQRQATIIELRYFGGRTIREVAELLGVSEWTIENDFRVARAWLRGRLETVM